MAIVPPAIAHAEGGTTVTYSGAAHFWVVGSGALVATVAGLVLSFAGWRRGDARPVLIGTAFSVMAALLVVHGLATPGVLVGMNGVVALTGAGDPPGRRRDPRPGGVPRSARSTRRIDRLLAAPGRPDDGVVALGVIALVLPVARAARPGSAQRACDRAARRRPRSSTPSLGCARAAHVPARAAARGPARRRRDRLARRGARTGADAWTTPSSAGGSATASSSSGSCSSAPPSPSTSSAPIRRARSPATSAAPSSCRQEEAFLGSHVRALTRGSWSRRIASTEEHTRRVALLAVRSARSSGSRRAGCARSRSAASCTTSASSRCRTRSSASRPRSTTTSSPSSSGTRAGATSCCATSASAAGSGGSCSTTTSASTAAAIRAALHEADLDLDTRILAVCDVYDALVSPRVYRDAWPHERALALLRDEAGTRLDPRCVQALERVLGRDLAAAPVAA